MLVTPLVTAVLALIYVALSFAVIGRRLQSKIGFGDGGDRELSTAIRVHANFIEYVPLSILLFWFIETVLFDSDIVAVLGLVLVVARILHIVGMRNPRQYMVLRQVGIVATLSVIVIAAIRIIWHYVPIS